MSSVPVLWFVQMSDFLTTYINTHKTGVMGVRLCTLCNLTLNFIKKKVDFQMFANWILACMPDAPDCGYSICVWTLETNNLVPHVSYGEPALAVVSNDGSNPRPTIHTAIANHVRTMADGIPVVAFEVSFFDNEPGHTWIFVTK